jgi:hypothetical protein
VEERNERHLATIAVLAHEQGHHQLAMLLSEVQRLVYRSGRTVRAQASGSHLECEPHVVARFDERGGDDQWLLSELFERVAAPDGIAGLSEVVFAPRVENLQDWRKTIKEAMTGGPNNQAKIMPLEPQHRCRTGCTSAVARNYRSTNALKKAQQDLPEDRTIGILVNPLMKVKESTQEPDLLVTYGGRVALLEVDGPLGHSAQRRVLERSKERLYEDCGVQFVDRIDVATTDDQYALEQFIGRFVRRLMGG